MKLYLVQHGEATPKEINPDRPLTEKGRADVTKTANFLKASGVTIDVILHSVKLRATQTAQVFAKVILPKESTLKRTGLSPNDPVDRLLDEIASDNRDIMVVGHLPFLQKFASLALLGSETSGIIGFNKGGVVCLERKEDGGWQLIFEITPNLLK